MSEFKFACPVCGQRMAVDSSATGAQVECPTCFQIVIVPKAPTEGSRYQLSATQYIKPVVLPPPNRPKPVVPQRKTAVLIFILIFTCAVTTALFIREKIISSQEEEAMENASHAPRSASRLWKLDLSGAAFPERPVAGQIHGRRFVSREAVLQGGLLKFRSERRRQPAMSAAVFIFTNAFSVNSAQMLSGRSFEVGTNDAGYAPGISLFWQDGQLRVMEMFTNGFAMKLQFGRLSDNRLPGEIYVCLPDKTRSYLAGTFTADVQRLHLAPAPSP